RVEGVDSDLHALAVHILEHERPSTETARSVRTSTAGASRAQAAETAEPARSAEGAEPTESTGSAEGAEPAEGILVAQTDRPHLPEVDDAPPAEAPPRDPTGPCGHGGSKPDAQGEHEPGERQRS